MDKFNLPFLIRPTASTEIQAGSMHWEKIKSNLHLIRLELMRRSWSLPEHKEWPVAVGVVFLFLKRSDMSREQWRRVLQQETLRR